LDTPDTRNIRRIHNSNDAWRPLITINLFRFLIAAIFIGLYLSDKLFTPLASHNPALFISVSISYAVISLVISILNYYRKPSFEAQAYINIYSDIIAITLLMHASGGVSSGLGTLMVITIGGGSIIMGGRHALLFASLSTIAVLIEEIFSQFESISQPTSYIQAGILGITFFVTAILTHTFAKRIRESEALAQKRGIDLANMAQLTEHIIQRMQTGIIVVDSDNQLRLINESALHMLGDPSGNHNMHINQLNTDLAEQLACWKTDPDEASQTIKASAEHAEIMPRFAQISSEAINPGTLIFLEDTSALSRQAQQLQLASLGRLTASIAHEIRNPLGAISHAGQLLEESPNLDTHDQRLTQIISNHSKRVNTIIENIMQLGRRNTSYIEIIELKFFLEKFRNDLLAGNEQPYELIDINIQPADVKVRFDVTHLQQILTNLCENGLRYSKDYPGFPKVELRGGISDDLSRPYLEVIDHGPGINKKDESHIFEPFYTTSNDGTGLGLYISRELTECNQAHLNYIPVKTGGSCFRITFQDPRRQIN
jgi:two-component system sensor histidine kinase PilS (NtrC family)